MTDFASFYLERQMEAIALSALQMREPGLEPGSLSTPDPKADPALSPASPKRSRRALENATPGKVAEARGATEIAPAAMPTTAPIATCSEKLSRSERSRLVSDAFKARKLKQREAYCEACRWRPPKGLALLAGPEPYELLHAHHALPIACGGEDNEQNLVLLCPRCHSLAHRLGRMSEPGEIRRWTGPSTRAHLLYELRLLLRDSTGWQMYVARGRRYAEVVEIERQQAEVREGTRRFEVDRGDPAVVAALAAPRKR